MMTTMPKWIAFLPLALFVSACAKPDPTFMHTDDSSPDFKSAGKAIVVIDGREQFPTTTDPIFGREHSPSYDAHLLFVNHQLSQQGGNIAFKFWSHPWQTAYLIDPGVYSLTEFDIPDLKSTYTLGMNGAAARFVANAGDVVYLGKIVFNEEPSDIGERFHITLEDHFDTERAGIASRLNLYPGASAALRDKPITIIRTNFTMEKR